MQRSVQKLYVCGGEHILFVLCLNFSSASEAVLQLLIPNHAFLPLSLACVQGKMKYCGRNTITGTELRQQTALRPGSQCYNVDCTGVLISP